MDRSSSHEATARAVASWTRRHVGGRGFDHAVTIRDQPIRQGGEAIAQRLSSSNRQSQI